MVGHPSRVSALKNSWPIGGTLGSLILAMVVLAGPAAGRDPNGGSAAKPPFQRRGFYLHACWHFNYPFAVCTWQREDYQNMFQLLRHLGFNTVMLDGSLWECAPMLLSLSDRQALIDYRLIIEDAQKVGIETWLVQDPGVTVRPEIAVKPLRQRSLYAHMQTVRLDNPKEAEAYLKHRADAMEILNNADAYVTIDGDPGGYPGAKPSEFLKILLHDRQTIDRVGTHPKSQKIIPWIWCGWGTKGVWQEPIEPFVAASCAIKQQNMPEPWELLPGHVIGKDGPTAGPLLNSRSRPACSIAQL